MKIIQLHVIVVLSFFLIFFTSHNAFAELTILGKSVSCENLDLAGNGTQNASFSFSGTFTTATTLDGSFTLDMDSRKICDFGKVTFRATYNSTNGLWTSSNLSFRVSAAGYLSNFNYSKSAGTTGTCRLTMGDLKLSGSAMPWLMLLTEESSDNG
jgi:hypothetical protein